MTKIRDKPAWNRFKKFIKVNKNGCWEWQGARHRQGYGMFGYGGKVGCAHRFVMWLIGHNLTTVTHVCHKCNNTRCVNPTHLYVGDRFTNQQDSIRSGTHVKFKAYEDFYPNAKLTIEEVREIRRKYIPYKYSYRKLAKEYGVSSTNILDIIKNRIWKD